MEDVWLGSITALNIQALTECVFDAALLITWASVENVWHHQLQFVLLPAQQENLVQNAHHHTFS